MSITLPYHAQVEVLAIGIGTAIGSKCMMHVPPTTTCMQAARNVEAPSSHKGKQEEGRGRRGGRERELFGRPGPEAFGCSMTEPAKNEDVVSRASWRTRWKCSTMVDPMWPPGATEVAVGELDGAASCQGPEGDSIPASSQSNQLHIQTGLIPHHDAPLSGEWSANACCVGGNLTGPPERVSRP